VQKPGREPLAALVGVDADLPHEDRVRLRGADESGDESDDPALDLHHHGALRELRPPQHVCIGGVEVENAAVSGNLPHAGSVGRGGHSEQRVGRIRVTGYYSFSWVHSRCPP